MLSARLKGWNSFVIIVPNYSSIFCDLLIDKGLSMKESIGVWFLEVLREAVCVILDAKDVEGNCWFCVSNVFSWTEMSLGSSIFYSVSRSLVISLEFFF